MGPENMTPEKLDTLHRFSLIYTRESLTYDYFQSLGLPNLCLLPDPAFILPAEHCELPACLSDH
jgi:polysaccharide pyruvyl transferase WcaK-like protein